MQLEYIDLNLYFKKWFIKHKCCFVARQFLSQIYAVFGLLFTALKMRWHTKTDKYEVWECELCCNCRWPLFMWSFKKKFHSKLFLVLDALSNVVGNCVMEHLSNIAPQEQFSWIIQPTLQCFFRENTIMGHLKMCDISKTFNLNAFKGLCTIRNTTCPLLFLCSS